MIEILGALLLLFALGMVVLSVYSGPAVPSRMPMATADWCARYNAARGEYRAAHQEACYEMQRRFSMWEDALYEMMEDQHRGTRPAGVMQWLDPCKRSDHWYNETPSAIWCHNPDEWSALHLPHRLRYTPDPILAEKCP